MKQLNLIFTLVLALFAFACNADTGQQSETTSETASAERETPARTVALKPDGVGVGDKAPVFKLKNVDGKEYSFQNIKDGNGNAPKGYIVIFTCNTCPYAVASEQRIIDLHAKYAPMGYPVVAIQPNDPAVQPGDSFAAMQKRAQEKEFPFLYLFDEGQEVFPKYGATRTPEVYLVDKSLTVRYTGAIDDSVRDAESVKEKFLENAIEAIEKGEEPKPAATKAVGCGIKTA
ncbi:MAG: thioredoxin family protein [Lewinellaceae bacterium]|nr:thioredoxin family protein [Phaeodactylibacter sp.]MCB9036202.1 thioredoxin family protein [Lewinellaceae bacterium]